jgi:hypothetical protein
MPAMWTCNICGTVGTVPLQQLDREESSCQVCGSTPRYRAVVAAISREVFGHVEPIDAWPDRRDVKVCGLTDWFGYADRLPDRLDYVNTFYHCEPFLDITDPPPNMIGQYDMLIVSDVFEHVPQPVFRAFTGAARLLREGGLLVFTVPYGHQAATIEHYPDVHEFTIEQDPPRVVNRTITGEVQTFPDPIFHGGDGLSLEMRVFSLDDLSRLFAESDLDMRVAEPELDVGAVWPEPWSRLMLVRKGRRPAATIHSAKAPSGIRRALAAVTSIVRRGAAAGSSSQRR